jgi:hypothetical protein
MIGGGRVKPPVSRSDAASCDTNMDSDVEGDVISPLLGSENHERCVNTWLRIHLASKKPNRLSAFQFCLSYWLIFRTASIRLLLRCVHRRVNQIRDVHAGDRHVQFECHDHRPRGSADTSVGEHRQERDTVGQVDDARLG